MQEFGWISVIGTNTEQDISKLGHNLHAYLTWYFLHLKADILFEAKIQGRSINARDIAIHWTPFVKGKDSAKYREILGTIQNLIYKNILTKAQVDYLSYEGEDDEIKIFQTITLDKLALEKENSALDLGYHLFNPNFEGLRFTIWINDKRAYNFITRCIEQWQDDNIKHYSHNYFLHSKQKEFISDILRKKFEVFENLEFTLNHQEIPKEIDGFLTLLKLEKEKFIYISHKKRLESEEHIPSSFDIGILKQFDGVDSNKELNGNTEVLQFVRENGKVVLKGEVIGTLRKNTLPYKFFEYLFNHKNNFVTHEEIGESLKVFRLDKERNTKVLKYQKTLGNYLSDIRGRLPEKIRDLVQSSKGTYKIDTLEL